MAPPLKTHNSFKCDLCPKDRNIHYGVPDEHHLIPQASGGEKGPVINICGNCHHNLHRQALNVIASRNGKTPVKAYFSPDIMQIARPYIAVLVASILRTKEESQSKIPVPLQLKVPRGFRDMLHVTKHDDGFSNLEKYVKTILAKHLMTKGVNVDKDFCIVE